MALFFTYVWPYITQFIPSLLDDEEIEPCETISLKIDNDFRENINNNNNDNNKLNNQNNDKITPQKRDFEILKNFNFHKSSTETIHLHIYLDNKSIKEKFFTKYKKYKSADDIFNINDDDDDDKPIGYITKVHPQGYYQFI